MLYSSEKIINCLQIIQQIIITGCYHDKCETWFCFVRTLKLLFLEKPQFKEMEDFEWITQIIWTRTIQFKN